MMQNKDIIDLQEQNLRILLYIGKVVNILDKIQVRVTKLEKQLKRKK